MISRNALKAIVMATTTCLAPFAAFADDAISPSGGAQTTNEAETDVMGVMGRNANLFGRYNGFTTTGVDFVGQYLSQSRPLWSSDSTWYYNFSGNNLVLQSGNGIGNYTSSTSNSIVNNGSIDLNFGQQGRWESSIGYDSISYTGNVIDSIYTIHGNQATLNGNLQPWGGATAGAGTGLNKTFYTIPNLLASGAEQPFQTGTRRDIVSGNFKYIQGDWTYSGAVRHEHKEGSMEESFDGPWGGTAFALPIDYDTDRYDLTAAYTTRMNQVSLQYTFANFSDANSFITLPYPYSNTAKPYQLSAAYSTPPSTSAHYITFMAATNMVPKTRINGNLRVGWELQNADFAPATADPNPTGASGVGSFNSMLQGTSASSPNASATVYQGTFSVSTHPIEKVDGRVFYGFDGRTVSINQYQVFTGGTGGSSDSALNGVSYVVPQDWFKQNAGVEAGYRLFQASETKLTAGYRFDDVNRTNAQVNHSTTNTETVAVNTAIGTQIFGRLTYEHADRSAILNYLTPWAALAGTNATAPAYSGAYYQAPLTSDSVRLMTSYTPRPNLTGSLFIQFKNEDYNYPAVNASDLGTGTVPLTGTGEGVKNDYNLTVGPDVTYRPTEKTNVHFFYTYERIYFNNLGNGACASSNTGTNTSTGCNGSVGYFQNQSTSSVHTVGLSGDWKVTEKLKLGAEYTFSYGSVMFGEFNGVFIPGGTASYMNVTNYPDIDSRMHSVKLTANYEVAPGMDLLAQATWSYYRDNNFNDSASAIQGAGSNTISILTPGYGSPNFDIATIMTGVRFKF